MDQIRLDVLGLPGSAHVGASAVMSLAGRTREYYNSSAVMLWRHGPTSQLSLELYKPSWHQRCSLAEQTEVWQRHGTCAFMLSALSTITPGLRNIGVWLQQYLSNKFPPVWYHQGTFLDTTTGEETARFIAWYIGRWLVSKLVPTPFRKVTCKLAV